MIVIVSILVVAALAVGACLVVLRRRGGAGQRGALERGAAEQGLAQGLSMSHARNQNTGGPGI
ncbi:MULTISPECIES: hypothetical protein [unclassified Streptomyces]|uniref:hypothetical protein n=1 Tax=Streptomyces TaxID=1883 RepID=UPI00136D3DA7|nr:MULTISPECIES: hypothetical protein [unclassified Streptomyces]NEA01322.1 hypothetical protein [Streptomyces sp. SID10116]MYY83943.1 hypothetical protein [Streptomyces sp. SID335]MYZ12121.1 hypothetical protein [Streptomyces sp. SID337]NDZ84145.1 hypothetical protein [Streptomyces sp. SID10115]NEB44646.1 hypothetical protein [Streptomyces sp. SID339]